MPGIGFAMGMERLLLAIDTLPGRDMPESKLDVFLAVLDEEYTCQAMQVLENLRNANLRADRDYNGRSMKAQMKFADKLGARVVVLMGKDEIESGSFTIRNMNTREQIEVAAAQLIPAIKDILV